jgi:predicted ATP-dependent endonuclease of OLD family
MYIYLKNLHKDISTNYNVIESENDSGYLPISKVNILIGANNSGKSRFMRGLMKSENIFHTQIANIGLKKDEIVKRIEQLLTSYRDREDTFFFNIDRYKEVQNELSPIPENDSLIYLLNKVGTLSINSRYFENAIQEFNSSWDGNIDFLKEKMIDKINALDFFVTITSDNTRPFSKAVACGIIIDSNEGTQQRTVLIANVIPKIKELLALLKDFKADLFEVKKKITYYYIPSLRTIHSLYKQRDGKYEKISEDILENTARNNFEFSKEEEKNIHSGQHLYREIRRIRNNTKVDRDRFTAFERFIKENFFQDKDIDIVALDSDSLEGQHVTVYIDDQDHHIHQLGDGIQSIIVLMFTIFNAKENAWILIEEPELSLHPGLQRMFLSALLNNEIIKSKKLTIFFTSHSNHFLDIASSFPNDISINHFVKKYGDNQNAVFEISPFKQSNQIILNDLGVKNSSVLLSNCSIWVEGPTDLQYIRAYIEAYRIKMKNKGQILSLFEGLNYSFFLYGGSLLEHYIFSEKDKWEEDSAESVEGIKALLLSNKIFLIADKDKDKEKKHNYFESQANGESFIYYCLDVNEIENTLSEDQIRKYLPLLTRKITDEKAASFNFGEINLFESEKLGFFLSNTDLKDVLPKIFKKDSGTLAPYYKAKLASLAANDMKWEEMSEHAKKLSVKIIEYIQEANG